MPSFHFKLLGASQESFRAMRRAMSALPFDARGRRGFVLDEGAGQNSVKGKLYYIKTANVKQINPKDLKPVETKTETLTECRFEVDQQHGLVASQDRRGELNVLFEQLDAMPDVHVTFEDLNLNLKDYVFELQSAFNKNEIRALRIRDYQAREPMAGNASFKVLDARESEKIVEKYSDRLDSVTVSFKLPDGRCNLTATRRGSLRFSDNAPDELVRYARDCMPRFHEAEVETTEVMDPVAARRKRR